ncbi:MAG: hypothetical protein KatS3mg102_2868 [Planctomycetota bacterium]|nr:MAG: hypothetical protein KatS3mg102_2868 [Planctomycetota bacterium]
MTLKGSLEVLNLSDIFQSLSMNQHTGTLRVTDGRRERLVYFAEGEITLLSSDKKLRLGDMLVAEGKLTPEDLEYALERQREAARRGQTRKLGEILVEEGFVSEDDIAALVRRQIEEQIYDLFLWKQAEFEFLIDYCPEELKSPGHNVTHLKFNTSSLIMEAMRRLDEWERIAGQIPSRKEVFRLVASEEELDRLGLSARQRAELHLIDGERNVEQIVEDTNLGEFETYRLLYALRQAGAIEPLSPEELSDAAEDCYARGRFRQAVALYERLAELLPKNGSIRWHLAEALRAYGDERRALEELEAVVAKLERRKDRAELARAYRAILEIAPERKDIQDKLRKLGRAYRRAGVLRVALVALVAAALAAGAVIAVRHTEQGRRALEFLVALWQRGGEQPADASEKVAKTMLERGRRLLEEGRVRESFEELSQLLRRYPHTEAAGLVALPLRVRSQPSGKQVFINGVPRGQTDGVFRYLPVDTLVVELREGGRSIYSSGPLDPLVFHDLFVDLQRKALWSFATDGAVRAAPVFRQGVCYFPSLDGRLYGVRLSDRSLVFKNSLREGELDPFGEAVSSPALAGDQLVLGTLDGSVLVFDLQTRRRVVRRQLADRPLLARPAIIEDNQTAVLAGDDGALVFFSLRQGEPLATVPVAANRITAPLVVAEGVVFVAGWDNRLVAVDLRTRRPEWHYQGAGDYRVAPVVVADVLVAGDAAGEVVCLGRRGGELRWLFETGSEVTGIAASAGGELVVVACADGTVRAIETQTRRLLWQSRVEGRPGVPVCDERGLYLATQGGTLYALELREGLEAWSAQHPGPLRGELVLHEGRLYVGCEDGRLYCYAVGID